MSSLSDDLLKDVFGVEVCIHKHMFVLPLNTNDRIKNNINIFYNDTLHKKMLAMKLSSRFKKQNDINNFDISMKEVIEKFNICELNTILNLTNHTFSSEFKNFFGVEIQSVPIMTNYDIVVLDWHSDDLKLNPFPKNKSPYCIIRHKFPINKKLCFYIDILSQFYSFVSILKPESDLELSECIFVVLNTPKNETLCYEEIIVTKQIREFVYETNNRLMMSYYAKLREYKFSQKTKYTNRMLYERLCCQFENDYILTTPTKNSPNLLVDSPSYDPASPSYDPASPNQKFLL